MKGSVFKRCQCPRTYDTKGRLKACNKRHGSWSYVVDTGKDTRTGRRRQLTKGGFDSRSAAEAALAQRIHQVETGRHRYDERMTLASYLRMWISQKEGVLRATTLRDYQRHIDVHIVPRLGHLRLQELRTAHITGVLADLLGGDEAHHPLGVTTVRRVHATVRSALRDAVRAELVEYNAAQNAVVPSAPKFRVKPWEPEELGAFLDFISSDPLAPVFELIAATGVRRGEAAGLRWADVNLTEGYLVVRQQIVQLDGVELVCGVCHDVHRNLQFGPPKTASGDARRVDLSELATGALLVHHLTQQSAKEVLGEAYRDHDLVAAQPNGDPMPPERLTKRFSQLVRQAGIRPIRLHDLRHGRASMLLASGSDITVVSKLMGHSSHSFTADTYAHLLSGVGKRAAEAADALIPRKPREQSVSRSGPEAAEAPSRHGGPRG